MTPDYRSITEDWNTPASREQVAMQYTRYRIAADLSKGKRVLEVGCGAGMGLDFLAHRATLTVGLEFSDAIATQAVRHVLHAPIVRGDAQRLPFADGAFDVVLMLEMIYYLREVGAALDECRRVLGDGGTLLICQPNPERPDFNPSAFATGYLNALGLYNALRDHRFEPSVYAGFPCDADSTWDRVLRPIRRVAIKSHLIPRSMRGKAFLKRVIYGKLPRLGAVTATDSSGFQPPLLLDPTKLCTGYKNLYATGVRL